MRREVTLLPEDETFLNAIGHPWESVRSGNWPWILIHGFPPGQGYRPDDVTLAIKIEPSYPDGQLDMVYFSPAITRVDGKKIGATEGTETVDGKSFQRWSRHRTPQNPWRPGEDNLETHMLLVRDWLAREFEKCPA